MIVCNLQSGESASDLRWVQPNEEGEAAEELKKKLEEAN